MSADATSPNYSFTYSLTANQGNNGISIFNNYILQKLLPHNPWWLRDAPTWCKDIRLSNETMASHAEQWSSNMAWEQYVSGLQQCDGIACPMEISVNETFGRHLIAARDILPGEILLLEPPLVLTLRPRSPPYCSACFKRAEDFTCPECGFFFCGPECLTESHKEECLILQHFGFVASAREKQKEEEILWERLNSMPPEQQEQARSVLQQAQTASALQRRFEVLQQYAVIPVIRTLLTMDKSELLRDVTLSLQSNVDETLQRYRLNRKRIVDVLINKLKVQLDPAFLHQICSIWDTNGFEVSLVWGTRVHGLYPFASLLTHDCQANTQQWFTNAGKLVLRAVEHIPKGKILTTCYTDPQWATMIRQDHLRITKQFTCTCKRCADPTEYGTFLGSPLCPKCSGLLVSTNPLDPTSQWVCNEDGSHIATAKEIASIGASIGAEIKGIDPHDIQGIDVVAENLQKKLHPRHHILLQLHVSNLKNIDSKDLSELSDEDLVRMSSMAALVMDIVRRVEPPLTRFTARMAREDLRLRLESMKRFLPQSSDMKEQLQALTSQARDCELVFGWDSRLPDMQPVIQEYQRLLNSCS